jgi:phosphonate transport system substrate-binding protein
VPFLKLILAILTGAALSLIIGAGASAAETSCEKDRPLVLGYSNQVFYNVDPRDAIGLTKVWIQTADRKSKTSTETSVVFFNNLNEIESSLKANKVDVVILIAEEYLKLRDRVPLAPVLSADYGNHFYDELLLLVRADSGITRLEQLRSKNLKIESGQKGAVPILWLDSFLKDKFSSDARHFFTTITDSPKASQVIMPLFFNQTDACLASRTSFETMVELNPQLGRKLHIMAKSPGFMTGIVAVRKDILNPRRDALVEIIRDSNSDPKGRQLLTLFRINRLVDFKTEHLASVEKVLKKQPVKTDSASRRKR